MIQTKKEDARKIIHESMNALGLRMNMKTDPVVIKALLKEMKLDDFKTNFIPMRKFFADAVTSPQPLRPMFESIIDGLCTKHPAVIEFAELALSKKWFAPSPHILRAAHVTYILEAMTAAASNNHEFFLEVQNHIRSEEKKCGIDFRHTFISCVRGYKVTHSIFETAKALSVDATMIFLRLRRGLANTRLNRKKLNHIRQKEALNFLEYKLLSPAAINDLEHLLKWVRVNIYEAGITEYKKGFAANTLCAQSLSEDILKNPPCSQFSNTDVIPMSGNTSCFYRSLLTEGNLFPTFGFSQRWVSLYITWNMAFLLSDVDDLDLLMPKLFIPSVINAESENFLGTRGISLWLSINNVLFRKSDHYRTVFSPNNKEEMAKAWGEINRQYAFVLAKKEMHEDPIGLEKGYKSFFSHPLFSFLKLMEDFMVR